MSALGRWLLLALLLGALLGALMLHDSGYLLLVYGDYSLETSFWGGILLLAALLLVAKLVALLLGGLLLAKSRLQRWNQLRLQRRSRRLLETGLRAFQEQRWQDAEKALQRAVKGADAPVVLHLFAARAAAAAENQRASDAHLDMAMADAHPNDLTLALTRAELQLAAGQAEQALALLLQLHAQQPKHPQVQRLLLQAQLQVGDGRAALMLLPTLGKSGALPTAALQTAAQQALRLLAATEPAALTPAWDGLPKDWRLDPALVQAYAALLLAAEHLDALRAAEAVLRAAIDKHLDTPEAVAALLAMYGALPGNLGATLATAAPDLVDVQRKALAAWLKKHPGQGVLLSAAGQVTLAAGELAPARELLESALALAPSAAVYRALGQLCEQAGEYQKACTYYAQSHAQKAAS